MNRPLITALFLFAAPALAQQPSHIAVAAKPHVDAWERCIVESARRFAKSPDSTEYIVKISMRLCDDKKRAISEAIHSAGASTGILSSMLELLEKDASQAAAVAILEVRSR